jgi:hypothetical protein
LLTITATAIFLIQEAFPFIGRGIPGVPVEYIPNQGAIQAIALEARMMTVAIAAAGVLFVLGALLAMKSQWDAPQPWFAQIKLVVIVAVMLSCYPFIFATPMVIARAAAESLFDGRDMAALNKDIREASLAEMAERAEGDPQEAWYQRLAEVTGDMNILTGGVLLEVFLALTTIIFYASVAGMTFLWKFFVVVLYVTGPLLIVMGLVGGFGERVLASWVTALVQVSLWQVWFAICAFFVRSADGFFYKAITEGSPRAPTPTITNRWHCAQCLPSPTSPRLSSSMRSSPSRPSRVKWRGDWTVGSPG